MKFAEVAENVKQLVECPPAKDEFIYELLLAYGTPKATIARLKSGAINLSKEPGEVLLKKKVYFKALTTITHHPVPAPLRGRGTETEKIPSMGGVAEGRGGSDLFAAMEALKADKKIKSNDPRFLKQTITMHVGNGLQERENHSGKTMAQLYDPDKMPDGLREAHHNLDLAVDRLYRSKPFTSDEERLEHLFKLYEEMTQPSLQAMAGKSATEQLV